MDINKILEYQKKDFEKIKLERELANNKDKKIVEDMVQFVKQTQNQSNILENSAKEILFEYEKLKQNFKENSEKLDELNSKKVDDLSENEILKLTALTETINNNLAIIEKKFIACAERINAELSNFELSKKKYMVAKEKHKIHKELYEAKLAEIEPKIKKITAELMQLAKEIEPSLLEKYNQKRQDNIFPILVPLSGKACGGCFTELSLAKQSGFKDKKILECDHCRRFIYID